MLGSHVVANCLEKGLEVRALYRSEQRKLVVKRLLDFYFPVKAEELYASIQWVKGDVLNIDDVLDAVSGCKTVIHCAALVSFRKRDFYRLWSINREGTANVINASLELGVEQLIHVSSTAAIGSDSQIQDGIKRETNHWNANEVASTYSYTKFSAEKEVWRGIEEGLKAAIVNPSVMFGPGSWDESSLTIFRTLHNGLNYYTKGGNAFVDVRDVADVILRLYEAQSSGDRYLVAGHNVLFKDLFDKMAVEMKVKAPHKLATPFMTELAWMASSIKSAFTGKAAALTKESARSAQKVAKYSSEKVLKRFPDFKFRSLEDTIATTVKGRIL